LALQAMSITGPMGPMMGPPALSLQLQQQYIGFIIGQGGEQLRQIKDASGVINIQINQDTKEQGFSTVQIYGPPDTAEKAKQLIDARIAELDPARRPLGAVEEVKVEQSMVGFLLGKGGETLKMIKLKSGAAVSIDQSTKDQGFSIVRIIGDDVTKAAARELVNAKMGESRGAHAAAFEFKIEQQHVGFLIGKGGETLRGIKDQTGANVVIDQATKDMGYSLVKILPGPGADAARLHVEAKLKQVETLVEEYPVDMHAVGLLIGRGGEFVRSLRDQTGATLMVEPGCQEAGYNMCRLTGNPEALVKAKELVRRKFEEMRMGCNVPYINSLLTNGTFDRRDGAGGAPAASDYNPPSNPGAGGYMPRPMTPRPGWRPNLVPPRSFGAGPPVARGGPPAMTAPQSFSAGPRPSMNGAPPPQSFAAVPPPMQLNPQATGAGPPAQAEVYDPFAE